MNVDEIAPLGYIQGGIIEFLKSLRVLPPGTPHLAVDEHGRLKVWPPGE